MSKLEWCIRSIIRVKCYGGIHICAGLVVENLISKNVYFLDEFNSKLLLSDLYRSTVQNIGSKTLDTIVGCSSLYLILSGVNFIDVENISDFIKSNNLIKKHRDAKEMYRIAKSIKDNIC